MTKTKLTTKAIYYLNIICSLLLVISYLSSLFYIKSLTLLPVINLAEPVLLIVNLIFVLYWLIKINKRIVISLLALIICHNDLPKLFAVNLSSHKTTDTDLSVMSYNVRLFNHYESIKEPNVNQHIGEFIASKNPDVLCIQEFHQKGMEYLPAYKYRYIYYNSTNSKIGVAIFSKYPIIDKGRIDSPKSFNNSIYADIQTTKGVIRIYNLHLESFRLDTEKYDFEAEKSKEIIQNMSYRFTLQKQQSELIIEHLQQTKLKKIICGDFNNLPFSYLYKQIRGEMKDTFEESAWGLGATYYLKFLPLRIDFIMTNTSFEVTDHQNYSINLSDHYPIKAMIKL